MPDATKCLWLGCWLKSRLVLLLLRQCRGWRLLHQTRRRLPLPFVIRAARSGEAVARCSDNSAIAAVQQRAVPDAANCGPRSAAQGSAAAVPNQRQSEQKNCAEPRAVHHKLKDIGYNSSDCQSGCVRAALLFLTDLYRGAGHGRSTKQKIAFQTRHAPLA